MWGAHGGQERALDPLELELTGSCEPSRVLSGKQTWVYCKKHILMTSDHLSLQLGTLTFSCALKCIYSTALSWPFLLLKWLTDFSPYHVFLFWMHFLLLMVNKRPRILSGPHLLLTQHPFQAVLLHQTSLLATWTMPLPFLSIQLSPKYDSHSH